MDKRSSEIRVQGSQFPPIGENDILGQVMGKKHYSQMRCVGFGVRKNDMFRASSSVLCLEENDKTLEKLKTKLEGEIETKMEKKMRRKMHAMLVSILSSVTEKGYGINHDEDSMESENISKDEGGGDEEDEGKDEKDDEGQDEDDH